MSTKAPTTPPSKAATLAVGAAFLLASLITMAVAWQGLGPARRPHKELIAAHERASSAASDQVKLDALTARSLVIPPLEGATRLQVERLPGELEPKVQVLWRTSEQKLISMFLAPTEQVIKQWRCRALEPGYTLCERADGAQRVTLLSASSPVVAE